MVRCVVEVVEIFLEKLRELELVRKRRRRRREGVEILRFLELVSFSILLIKFLLVYFPFLFRF